MRFVIYPTYKEVFDKSKFPNSIHTILHSIPPENLISICSFISASIYLRESKFEVQNELLIYLLKNVPLRIQDVIFHIINDITKDKKSIVFHNISILKIIEYALSRENVTPKRLTDIEFVNILQAFLFENENTNAKMLKLIDDLNKQESNQNLLEFAITSQVAQTELSSPDRDFVSQSYKSYLFFKYLSKSEHFSNYLGKFLKLYAMSDFHNYIMYIWNITIKMLKIENPFSLSNITNIIDFGENIAEKEFANIFCINFLYNKTSSLSEYNEDLDFKTLRKKPLYKIDNNLYAIMSFKFFIDKLFQGLQFDFYYFLENNGYTKRLQDYRSIIAKEFTEMYLFHNLMDYILENYQFLKIRSEFKSKKNIDYSDYFASSNDKVFLFECKDRLMNADKKYSLDKTVVLDDIKSKFITDGGGKQFINIFKQLSKGGFDFFKIEPNLAKKLIIYPVIVYTDATFSAEGINEIINFEFRKILKGHDFPFLVKDIVLIHLDTLINYQDYFNNKELDLFSVIEKYISILQNEFELQNKFPDSLYLTFDIFCQYTFNQKIKTYSKPEILDKIYHEIYD